MNYTNTKIYPKCYPISDNEFLFLQIFTFQLDHSFSIIIGKWNDTKTFPELTYTSNISIISYLNNISEGSVQ